MIKNDQIEALKQVKVPLWARLLGAYRARQRRKNAYKEVYYVATVFSWMYWTDTKCYSRRWYILKVDGTGKRFFEYGSDHSLLRNYTNDHEYARIIVPWMYGKYTNEQMKEYAKKTETVESKHGTL